MRQPLVRRVLQKAMNAKYQLAPYRTVEIGGTNLRLDMRNSHERSYFAAVGARTVSVDELIARKFVKPGDTILDAGANIGLT